MSYYTVLGLTKEPFSTSPDPLFFFRSTSHVQEQPSFMSTQAEGQSHQLRTSTVSLNSVRCPVGVERLVEYCSWTCPIPLSCSRVAI